MQIIINYRRRRRRKKSGFNLKINIQKSLIYCQLYDSVLRNTHRRRRRRRKEGENIVNRYFIFFILFLACFVSKLKY